MGGGLKKARERVLRELHGIREEISVGFDKLKKEGAIISLEWGRIAGLADLELRVRVLSQIEKVLFDAETEGKEDSEMVYLFHNWIIGITKDLIGDDFLGGSNCGPWDRHSTSPGSNRLAILQANAKRYEIRELRRIINTLEGK